jgi:hypothetical protein
MTRSRHINRPKAIWTPDLEAVLIMRYPHEKTSRIAADIGMTTEQLYKKATLLGLKKTPEYLASADACRLRRGGDVGAAFRFQKGRETHNKGKKGICYPGCEATQFKKGHKLNEELPLGALRINADGYLDRKVSMTANPPARRWVGVHRLVWIERNGLVPEGHIVVFKPGMRTTNPDEITIEKVELVSRAEHMKRHTLHNYPKEIAQLIQLRGAVNRKINRRLKDERATTPE